MKTKKRLRRKRLTLKDQIRCPACGVRFNPNKETHVCSGMESADKDNEYEEV